MATSRFSLIATLSLLVLPSVLYARADHLLISEILVQPTGTQTDDESAEYVEIFNPTTATISLENYYLSSYKEYYTLPAGSFDFGDRSNFMLRFPNDTTIAPNSTIVVTQGASTFLDQLGSKFGGSLESFAVQSSSPSLFEVKDTLPAISDMINLKARKPRQDTLALNDDGGHVVLFYWDTATDLVQDVDIVRWGNPSSANELADKSGASVDGPDADTNASTYADDNGTLANTYTGSVISMKRVLSDETDEANTGGNGITGHDETTEDLHSSFASVPFTAISPGPPNVSLYPAQVDNWQVY